MIQTINFKGKYEGPEIPEWVNEPYKRKRAEIESEKIRQKAQVARRQQNQSNPRLNPLEKDSFTPSGKTKQVSKDRTKANSKEAEAIQKMESCRISRKAAIIAAIAAFLAGTVTVTSIAGQEPVPDTGIVEPVSTTSSVSEPIKIELPITEETTTDEISEETPEVNWEEAQEQLTQDVAAYMEQKEKEMVMAALDEKLGAGFSNRLEEVCENVNCDMRDLIGLMRNESGINPKKFNDDGAVGLIQFMPETAQTFGTTTYELSQMSGTKQLDYVEKCINYWRRAHEMPPERKLTGGELYAMTFVPSYMNDDVLVYSGMWEYEANVGLDKNNDGEIDKDELQTIIDKQYEDFIQELV